MFSRGYRYDVSYETTKAYQAEMRDVAAQDRIARQALPTAGTHLHLAELLRDVRRRLWMIKLGQGATAEARRPR
jgi:hypothetical protein